MYFKTKSFATSLIFLVKYYIIQEVINLLARVYNFAVFQTRSVKTQVFTLSPLSVLKDFALWQKIYFLYFIIQEVINLLVNT
ncbi:MAG TPA: hypothetical protein DDW16_00510 [Clostridiales bacterium]|nr:hypothetical protein [Clostridiales bacterium]